MAQAMLDILGPNISTIDGLDWQRHRKRTSSSFNERTKKRVWSEALSAAWLSLESTVRRTVLPTLPAAIRSSRGVILAGENA